MDRVSVKVDGGTPHVENGIASGATIRERISAGYERLKPGPGQSSESVRANQRARIHRAMVELATEVGYEHVTVRGLTRTAGISSRTFYGHFPNREECMASTVDSVGRRILCGAVRRGPIGDDRTDRVTGSLHPLLTELAAQPEAARLLFVESFAAGRPARTRAAELTSDFERLVAYLLATDPDADAPSRWLVIGIAAGLTRVATMTTVTERLDELPGLSAELGSWMLEVSGEQSHGGSPQASRDPGRKRRREPSPLPAASSALDRHGDEERILSATSRLAAGSGFAALDVSKIRREAGVSRSTFDSLFSDKVECFLASIESVAGAAANRAESWAVATAAEGQRTYRGMLALCAIAARNQALARLVLAGILSPGRDGLLRREQLISCAAERFRAGPVGSSNSRSALATQASVAAVWRIAESEIVAGRGARLPEAAHLLSGLLSVRSGDLVPS